MRRASGWALLAAAGWLTASALAQKGAIGELDVGGSDDIIVVQPPRGGTIALTCTFHPDGAIDDCRRVGVRGEAFPLR